MLRRSPVGGPHGLAPGPADVVTLLRMFETVNVMMIAGVGLAAGLLGGMLGVGGSVIMIPALVMLFGQGRPETPGLNQHLYQAAAMMVNVAVVVPAWLRHRRAGAVRPVALKLILPAAGLCIILGVLASNLPIFRGEQGATWLGRVLAVFLGYVIVVNLRRLASGRREAEGQARLTWPRGSAVGGSMGFAAGLMGIGGGAVAVPLQQTLMKLPLRHCIANSTAIICITAGIGAIVKNATLPPQCSVTDSLILAGLLAPTAIAGGYLGGSLTHKLPLKIVRGAFVLLLIVAAWKMADLPYG